MSATSYLPPDDHAKIMARRKYNEERKQRILDPRNSKMGVDYAALGAQIEERKLAAAAVRASDLQVANDLKEYDRMALLIDQKEREARMNRNMENAKYLLEKQTPESRDSYELNKPNMLRSAQPARLGDDDPRLGAASIQVFAGEDLGFDARKKAQQEQMKMWTAQSAQEQSRSRMAAQQAAAEEHTMLMHQIHDVEKYDTASATARAQRTTDFKQANIEMLAAQREAARQQRLQKLEDDQKDIDFQISGPLLEEDPARAVGPTGKILTDRFKGFTPDQLAAIRDEQARQVTQNAQRRASAADEEAEIAQRQVTEAHALLLAERKAARMRRERVEETARANRRASQERRGSDIVSKNEIDDSFFSQFGTSCR